MWPFKKTVTERRKTRELQFITIDQNVVPGGKVTSGFAFFPNEPNKKITAVVPIDALGELVLLNLGRLCLEFVDLETSTLPDASDAKPDHLYLAVRHEPNGGYTALLGGLKISPPVCDCKNHGVDWHKSKIWESKFRAVGMMALEWRMLISLIIHFDYGYPIRLRHPDEPDRDEEGDDHCCCSV